MNSFSANLFKGDAMNNKEVMELLEGRRTYRRFDESRQIPDDVIADMKRATKLASSAMNRQPMRYIFIRTPETVNAVFEITSWGGALPNGLGRPKLGERPTLFVVLLTEKALQSRYTAFDEGLAANNLTLAAYAHGVGSCILGSVNAEKLRNILCIDCSLDISCVIGFGYPTHTSTVVEMIDGDTKYYLDDNKNYMVPKRSIEETVSEI
jgi:nitroreductase